MATKSAVAFFFAMSSLGALAAPSVVSFQSSGEELQHGHVAHQETPNTQWSFLQAVHAMSGNVFGASDDDEQSHDDAEDDDDDADEQSQEGPSMKVPEISVKGDDDEEQSLFGEVSEEGAGNGFVSVQQSFSKAREQATGNGLVYVILVFALAYLYKEVKMKERMNIYDAEQGRAPLLQEGSQWRYGLCSCFEVPMLCCFSCCCGPIRWADTLSMANIIKFWHGVVGYLCLSCLAQLSSFCCYPCVVGVYTYFRQELRRKLDMPHGDVSTIAGDCCTVCCCMSCAIVQEARQVEDLVFEGRKFETDEEK